MHIIICIPLSHPVRAEVTIPGSKSYTNRAVLIAAMIKGIVVIKNPLFSDDTLAMIHCLRTLGIEIDIKTDCIKVIGSLDDIKNGDYVLNAQLSGTTLRFLLPLLTIVLGTKILTGGEGLRKRPIKELVDALRTLGADIAYIDTPDYPPLRVTASTFRAQKIVLDGGVSSQYISALLMIAPLVSPFTIEVHGVQISKPYIDMTIDIMKQFGVVVVSEAINDMCHTYFVSGQQMYHAKKYVVEGDFSGAGYFFAIAALTRSTLKIKNLNPDSVQPDKKLLSVLEQMGSKIIYSKKAITIQGGGVKPMEIQVVDCPDQAQTLAVLAAFAQGSTTLLGVRSLHGKETERVVALEQELRRMQIGVVSTIDTMTITGGNPQPARIRTYGDHRMAMSFAIAGAQLHNMEICHPEVVTKTFPDFWKQYHNIGIRTKKVTPHIILIGMRGSGKTTVAQLLSAQLHIPCIDLDSLVVQKTGMSIADIVATHGWDYFRERESEIVRDITSHSPMIIATGGGVVVRSHNTTVLKKRGIMILLTCSVETMALRIAGNREIPFLTDKKNMREELEEIDRARKQLYEDAADYIINTDNRTPTAIVQEIISRCL